MDKVYILEETSKWYGSEIIDAFSSYEDFLYFASKHPEFIVEEHLLNKTDLIEGRTECDIQLKYPYGSSVCTLKMVTLYNRSEDG